MLEFGHRCTCTGWIMNWVVFVYNLSHYSMECEKSGNETMDENGNGCEYWILTWCKN